MTHVQNARAGRAKHESRDCERIRQECSIDKRYIIGGNAIAFSQRLASLELVRIVIPVREMGSLVDASA